MNRKEDFVIKKLVNLLMIEGKKTKAQKILQRTLIILYQKTGENPQKLLQTALFYTAPPVELRSRRKGAAILRIPFPLREQRRQSLGLRWIVERARKKKGGSMEERLAREIRDAALNRGYAVNRRREICQQAEANRALAFLRWF